MPRKLLFRQFSAESCKKNILIWLNYVANELTLNAAVDFCTLEFWNFKLETFNISCNSSSVKQT